MKRLLKWLAIILLIMLILLLLAVGISYFLLGTEKGFKLAAGQLNNRVEGLELGAVEGNLKTGIKTDTVSFKNEQVAVLANGVDSQWRSDCLFDREVCIDKIVIDELSVQAFATDKEEQPASTDDISLPDINLPVSLNAKEVLVKTFRFQPPGDAPAQELTDIKLSAFTDDNTLRIDELSTQYNNISLDASGNITPNADYPLDVILDIGVDDFLEEHDAKTSIRLSNTLNDLDVDILVSGAVDASIKGRVQPLLKKLPVNLTVSSQQAGWPLDTREQVQADEVSLKIKGDMDDYGFDLSSKIKGEQIPATTIKLTGQTNTERALLTDVTALTLGGFATGNAAVSWTNGITWVTEMIAKDINPGIKFDGADGKLNALIIANGSAQDGKWTLDLDNGHIDGELRGVPFMLDSKLLKNADDTWQLDSLTLDNGDNRIDAAGSLSDKWNLDANITLPQLQNLLPDLTGGFDGRIQLRGKLKTPDLVVRASSDALKYNDIAVAGLSLNAVIKEAALQPSTLALNVQKVQAGVQTISNTKLNFDGSRAEHSINFFTDGPQKTSIDLSAQGGLSDTFDWAGVLNNVKLEVPSHRIDLKDKTNLEWDNNQKKFSVDAHCWAIQDSNLCLKNKVLAQDTGKALVTLDTYKLEQLNPFLPAESTLLGQLDADITLDWGADFAGGYAATLNAGVTDGGIVVKDTTGAPLTFKYDTLTLKTKADANAVASNLTIDSQTMGQAAINLSLDPASENKDITGDVDLSGFQIGFLKAFLPNFDKIGGTVSARGNLSGPIIDPLFNGAIDLKELVVASEDLPLAIDDGGITATIAGKRAQLSGLLETGEGSVEIGGTANWLNNTWRSDIKIDAEKLSIVQEPVTSSTVNTKLTISARPERIRIRGSIDIPAAQIDIKEIPRGAATVSEDVIVIEDAFAATQKERQKSEAALDIDLNVNVSLGDDVNLSGYGLNAALTGAMSVSQKSPNPIQLGGEVTIVEGIYKQYGQDLTITDGQVLFVGPIDQATLKIDAVRTITTEEEERVAGLRITGQIEDPEITLFTEPADKSQESILAYIVLGRDIGGGAGGSEADLLASAAIALTLKGGRGYTDTVAEKLGVQEISLDTRSRGESTEVVVSSRVNDRLLLRYGRSVFDESYTLYLRYDLTKKLYLEAAQGTARAVDIFYSFSF